MLSASVNACLRGCKVASNASQLSLAARVDFASACSTARPSAQATSLNALFNAIFCRKSWVLVREKSTFVDWQRVKVQELSDEVRQYALPRRWGQSLNEQFCTGGTLQCQQAAATRQLLECEHLRGKLVQLTKPRGLENIPVGWPWPSSLPTRNKSPLPAQVPAGSLPRTMDVILRNDIVEAVRAGDKVEFTGALIVVPDISVATAPGERVTTRYGAASETEKQNYELNTDLSHHPACPSASQSARARSFMVFQFQRRFGRITRRRQQEHGGAVGHGSDGHEVAGRAGADLQAVLRCLLHHGACASGGNMQPACRCL